MGRPQAGLSTGLWKGGMRIAKACIAQAWSSGQGLLADAEAGEDAAEQVVGAEGPGDLAKYLLGLPQVFGQEFARAGQGELAIAMVQSASGPLQGVQVATPCACLLYTSPSPRDS